MKKHAAFTMIELIFVIVVMGIIGKFGVEFLAQAYKSFIFSSVNNDLQSRSASTLELIASRMQYRIKDSVIARTAAGATPVPIANASGTSYLVLEWIGNDVEGYRGNSDVANNPPNWSGILDLDHANATSNILVSPGTNTGKVSSLIVDLSNSGSSIAHSALYFMGSNSDSKTDYGWDGNIAYMNSQQAAMHPVNLTGTPNQFTSSTGTNFSGIDVYEYYKLAWTAYAIVYEPGADNLGTLRLYWDYQPWLDRDASGTSDQFNNGPVAKNAVLMENVSTFQFMSIGSIMKIQICAKSNVIEEYSLCKEKTIF